MIHVQTGNRLDVCEEIIGSEIRVTALYEHESKRYIELSDPAGLLAVLLEEQKRGYIPK